MQKREAVYCRLRASSTAPPIHVIALLETEVRILPVNGPRDIPSTFHVLLDIGEFLKPLHQALQVITSVKHVRLHRKPIAHRVVGHDIHVGDTLAKEPASWPEVAVQQLVEHDGSIGHHRQVQFEVLCGSVADVEEIQPSVLNLENQNVY